MWKYVTRRFRDTFERSANHFDKRPTTNVVNSTTYEEKENKRCAVPTCTIQQWFRQQGCWKDFKKSEENTNNNDWNFEQFNRTWIGAITWSSALALGWYTSQFMHMKFKCNLRYERECVPFYNIISTLKPYLNPINNRSLLGNSAELQKILKITPTVHLVTNEHNEDQHQNSTTSSGISSSGNSDSDLGHVLNSIENKLGLAAIQNGQHQIGLNLLRSAANRQYAPAMYNLGLCYENGLGVSIDEKMAMELFKSAAALQHPGALYNLGIYYGQGRAGLPRDLDTATRLLRLSAVQGQKDAIDALKFLEIEIQPHKEDIIQPWSQSQSTNDIVPSPTTLFVENVLFSHSPNYNTSVY